MNVIWRGDDVKNRFGDIFGFQFWHVLNEVVLVDGVSSDDVTLHQSWADALYHVEGRERKREILGSELVHLSIVTDGERRFLTDTLT